MLSDQGLKYVFVVDAGNTVQYRRVTTGPLQDDGLRVISDGLKPDEWVVVAGLQQVHSQDRVAPEQMPMPTLNQPGEGGTAPAGPDTRGSQSPPAERTTR